VLVRAFLFFKREGKMRKRLLLIITILCLTVYLDNVEAVTMEMISNANTQQEISIQKEDTEISINSVYCGYGDYCGDGQLCCMSASTGYACGCCDDSCDSCSCSQGLCFGCSGGGVTTSIPHTTTTTIKPIFILQHRMTNDPEEGSECIIPAEDYSFSTEDDTAYCWLDYQDGTENNLIEWKFYGPDSSLYITGNVTVQYIDGCAWGGLDIKNYPPANMPGNWHVDVYYNGIKQFTDTFTIIDASPPTTTTIPVTTTTTTIPVTTTTTTSIPANIPPNMPSNPYPSHGATDVPLSVMLSWDGGDPDNDDSLFYDIYLGVGSNLSFYMTVVDGRCEPTDLKPATSYKWKIIANDNDGGITEGPIWTFSTANASACAAETVLGDDKESLELLRQYRDKILSKSEQGKSIIKIYYEKSPHIVELLKQNPFLKDKCSAALKTIIPYIENSVKAMANSKN
jgi:hypothetical protein